MTRRKLGRLAPYPVEGHPRLRLANFLTGYPAAPAVVDYISSVDDWPMYGNDAIGDCTVAAAGHMIEAWTRYGRGKTVEVDNADVLRAYSAITGYVVGDESTDTGAVVQDVLSYWRKTGIGGHKILAFAEVNVRSDAELASALYLFGHVYLGVNLPEIAEQQFDDGQPWDVVRSDGGIAGGHAIDWGYVATGRDHQVITWGRTQNVTLAWFAKYVEEAWVVVSPEWIDTVGRSPEGLDVAALGAAFTAMTGDPSPFPVPPTPAPVPPAPVPVPPPGGVDDALAAAFRADNWLGRRHVGGNAHIQRAAKTWLAAKGI